MKSSDLKSVGELIRAGNLDGAAQLLTGIIQANPGEIEARLLLARLCGANNRFMAAFLLYRQVLDLDPSHSDAAKGLLETSYHTNETLAVLDRLRNHETLRDTIARLMSPPDISVDSLKLNLGCGQAPRPGYVNIDLFIDHPAVMQMDIRRLDLRDACAREILCVHVLEHFPQREVPLMLNEWQRVLAPNGRLHLEVPDLEWCLSNWLAAPEKDRWGWNLHVIFGNQDHDGEYHKTGFTPARLSQLLGDAGFAEISVERVHSHGQPSLLAKGRK
jgi:predicted SAM-dependent methyltransferase